MSDLNSGRQGSSGGPNWLAAMSIPVTLLVLPGVGGYAGAAADRHWGVSPWGILAGVVLGLVLAAVRIRYLLAQLSEEDRKEGNTENREK
ncbi:AtpZ/AtpI family protein [bacterium]|nr:AtpZ/AtpI family protein [bacterium]